MSPFQDLLSVLLDEDGFWSSLVMKEEEGIGWYQCIMLFSISLIIIARHFRANKAKPDQTAPGPALFSIQLKHLALAPWEFFYAFLSSADFFQNQLFRKLLSGILRVKQIGSRLGLTFCGA